MYQPRKPSQFKGYIQPKTTSQSQERNQPKTTSREQPSLPAVGTFVDLPTEGPPASLYHEHLTGLPVQNILAKAKELLHSVQPMIRPNNLPGATPLEHLIPLTHYTLGISGLFSKLSKYLKLKDKSGQGPLKNNSRLPDEAEPFHEMEWMSHPHFSRIGRTPKRHPKVAGLGCLEDTTVVTEEKDKREENKLNFTRMGRSSWRPHSTQTQTRENKFIRMAKRAGQIGFGKREKFFDKLCLQNRGKTEAISTLS